jgi:hypothetical protein
MIETQAGETIIEYEDAPDGFERIARIAILSGPAGALNDLFPGALYEVETIGTGVWDFQVFFPDGSDLHWPIPIH